MEDITICPAGMENNNDCDFFIHMYENVWHDIYRYCLYFLGNKEDAEDASQETALAAYQSIGKLKNHDSFRPWIFTIAGRKCKNRIGGLINKRGQFAIDDLNLGDDTNLPEGIENSVILVNAIQKLSPDERRIILLSFVAGYNSREISSMLKKPEGTVRSKLSRTLKKLRVDLEKE